MDLYSRFKVTFAEVVMGGGVFGYESRGCCGHCEARCPSGLGRKNASSSIFMPSCEGNVSAKAGDVVVGMKRTMKVWSMGLFARGS